MGQLKYTIVVVERERDLKNFSFFYILYLQIIKKFVVIFILNRLKELLKESLQTRKIFPIKNINQAKKKIKKLI